MKDTQQTEFEVFGIGMTLRRGIILGFITILIATVVWLALENKALNKSLVDCQKDAAATIERLKDRQLEQAAEQQKAISKIEETLRQAYFNLSEVRRERKKR